MENTKDRLSKTWWAISNACPPVGIYLYFRHRDQFPHKARKALQSALIGIPIAIVAGYIMNTFILH
ncbi:MAG: hypothetical protein GXC78_13055 [Chitinophagaceae bacterium]|jgi:hypothetical protein|nr:hypothetical protein [Chitinophagaceae bacterium]